MSARQDSLKKGSTTVVKTSSNITGISSFMIAALTEFPHQGSLEMNDVKLYKENATVLF